MRQVKRLHLALVGLALGASACGKPEPPPTFTVTFTTYADPGDRLAGVTIETNGNELGQTGADGTLRAELQGKEGAPVTIGAKCPPGHREAGEIPALVLRKVKSLDSDVAARGIEYSITCPPEQRLAAVVVRARTPGKEGYGIGGLPVLVSGKVVGTTDAGGVAHFAMKAAPSDSFRVVLDTSANPYLEPKNPSTTVTLADADDIVVFNADFKEERPEPPKKKVKKKVKKGPTGPIKL